MRNCLSIWGLLYVGYCVSCLQRYQHVSGQHAHQSVFPLTQQSFRRGIHHHTSKSRGQPISQPKHRPVIHYPACLPNACKSTRQCLYFRSDIALHVLLFDARTKAIIYRSQSICLAIYDNLWGNIFVRLIDILKQSKLMFMRVVRAKQQALEWFPLEPENTEIAKTN